MFPRSPGVASEEDAPAQRKRKTPTAEKPAAAKKPRAQYVLKLTEDDVEDFANKVAMAVLGPMLHSKTNTNMSSLNIAGAIQQAIQDRQPSRRKYTKNPRQYTRRSTGLALYSTDDPSFLIGCRKDSAKGQTFSLDKALASRMIASFVSCIEWLKAKNNKHLESFLEALWESDYKLYPLKHTTVLQKIGIQKLEHEIFAFFIKKVQGELHADDEHPFKVASAEFLTSFHALCSGFKQVLMPEEQQARMSTDDMLKKTTDVWKKASNAIKNLIKHAIKGAMEHVDQEMAADMGKFFADNFGEKNGEETDADGSFSSKIKNIVIPLFFKSLIQGAKNDTEFITRIDTFNPNKIQRRRLVVKNDKKSLNLDTDDESESENLNSTMVDKRKGRPSLNLDTTTDDESDDDTGNSRQCSPTQQYVPPTH